MSLIRFGVSALLAAALPACAEDPVPCGTCGPCTAVVTNVVDGDTIDLSTGARIRLLCADTPETKDGVDCWGPEASAHTKSRLLGKEVALEYEPTCTDQFGRTLAWVWVGPDLYNEELLAEGWARSLLCTPDQLYGQAVLAAEEAAKSDGLGLWGACDDE